MRIGDLSRHTGIPVPTIKYYQREGLLPYGERAGYNQVHYAEEHLRRLRLVRALVDLGRLPIATAKQVLTAVDDPENDLFKALGQVHYAVTERSGEAEPATGPVAELLERLGWQVSENNPSRVALAGLLGTLTELGHTELLSSLTDYAELAGRLAALDVGFLDHRGSQDEVLESAVVITLLGDVLVSLLRRMAQESHSARFRES
ncbi:MerR family transcriptional regulator [Crossiella sp. CA-258035]|uniref:MerR family transcriptional regulator n=1 Tax=Crossiella sp. CA-258035 TaxID=2981138 RepID=UPI0024BC033B|nr:MerR family transcriptional regulator [Crossiella sp. CA-258035]WHT22431.1 MerR family transcriptional regulator [Crossiella sp. CA-258035]